MNESIDSNLSDLLNISMDLSLSPLSLVPCDLVARPVIAPAVDRTTAVTRAGNRAVVDHTYARALMGPMVSRAATPVVARVDLHVVSRGEMARVEGRSGDGWTLVSRQQQRTSPPATIGSGGAARHLVNSSATAARPLANSVA